jgi:protease-4
MRRVAVACLSALAALGGACEGRPHPGSEGPPHHEEARSGPSVAVLDLESGVPEQPSTGLLGLSSKGGSFDALEREVERLRTHARQTRGVLVRLGATRIPLARATEIGALLRELGTTLPVTCHADELSNGTAYLALQGCKHLWLSPAGSVDAIGIAAQNLYFHKLLAEELGLDVDFLQVGKYKGAEEPFTRDAPSPEARESLQSTLVGLRSAWIDGIVAARPGVAPTALEDGPYAARDAKAKGLVDEIGYFDEARDAAEHEAGAERAEVRFGAGSSGGSDDELSQVLRAVVGESLETAPITLVRAEGAISLEGGGSLLGSGGGIVERHLARTLARVEKDDDVKAVVLRLDSPGGSALASDLLWHELMRVRARKPLVVSVGGMAASGGYYMASTGTVVFADPASIVGSIGVVGGKVSADRALERIGVHAETIPARTDDPRAGARAAYESLLTPWDDATRERLLQTMTGIYELFLARVAEGRHVPVERVAASAEGRIFAGRDALGRGLVDEMGGLAEAIAKARALAGLADDARVAVAGEGGGLLDALSDGDDDPSSAAASPAPRAGMGMSAGVGVGLDLLAPDLRPFVESMLPLLRGERALCALPFAMVVR